MKNKKDKIVFEIRADKIKVRKVPVKPTKVIPSDKKYDRKKHRDVEE